MRVISGKYKGRNLASPEGNDVRPTLSRVKESIFNIIQFDIAGKTVLDLFSGSGALGIEALSRGAKEAVFVDAFREIIALLSYNLRFVKEEKEILCCDAVRAVERLGGRNFGLVFMDPPYDYDPSNLFLKIAEKGILEEGAVIVYEHAAKSSFVLPEGLESYDDREYGFAAITLIRRKNG